MHDTWHSLQIHWSYFSILEKKMKKKFYPQIENEKIVLSSSVGYLTKHVFDFIHGLPIHIIYRD